MNRILAILDKAQRTDRIWHKVSCALGDHTLFPNKDQLLIRAAKLVRRTKEAKMENRKLRQLLKTNKRIERVRNYIKAGKDYKRWRLWRCIQGSEPHRRVETNEEIAWLDLKGFKAKVYVPLPEHKTSGHTHIVVLATFHEFCKLAGITIRS